MSLYRVIIIELAFLTVVIAITLGTREEYGSPPSIPYLAILNITYRDPFSGEVRHEEEEELGQYAHESRLDDEWGVLIHLRSAEGSHTGCSPPVNAPPSHERWIALIKRGECQFQQKIVNAAVDLNASAIIVYDYEYKPQTLPMKHQVQGVVAVFIKKESGEKIASLVDNGTKVTIHISRSFSHGLTYNIYGQANRSSVLFVSVSFIILMIISLAWLVFYYVQRVRYAQGKDRLEKQLINSARKVVNKMEQRTLGRVLPEEDSDSDMCAICVESYYPAEVIRILPCRHIFHKSCVDPWLIERRTCPMCKLDILRSTSSKNTKSNKANSKIGNRDLTTTTNRDAAALLPASVNEFPASPSSSEMRISRLSLEHDRDPDTELLLSHSLSVIDANGTLPLSISNLMDYNDTYRNYQREPSIQIAQVTIEPHRELQDGIEIISESMPHGLDLSQIRHIDEDDCI